MIAASLFNGSRVLLSPVWRPTVERVLGGVAPHLMVTDPPYGVNCDPAIAIAHLAARRFEQAIEWADRALHDQPRLAPAMRVKVVALAHLGHLDAARAELSRVLAIDPKLTIAGYRAYARFVAPEVLELYVAGLRLAGLPQK